MESGDVVALLNPFEDALDARSLFERVADVMAQGFADGPACKVNQKR